MSEPDEERPALRIVRGKPSEEDVAVLTALVSASGPGTHPAASAQRSGWSDPARCLGRAPLPGPNAWRATYLR